MLSHTPPKFTPGSYDPPMFNKRARAGSISGRLRSASDLCDEGIITPQEKGIIKDLIITGDPELETALETYEKGDPKELQGLLRGGSLARRRASIDLLADDLDLGVLNVGSLDSDKGEPAFNFDDIPFNPNIAGHEPQKSRADSFSDVFGSSFGLGGGSFGGHSLGISLGKSAQRGTSSSSQAAAAAAAASAFPFGTSPPETSYADEMLDPDAGFGFAGMTFPDIPPVAAAAPESQGPRHNNAPAATAQNRQGNDRPSPVRTSATATAGKPPRSLPQAASAATRTVSAPIGIPGAKRSDGGSGRKIGAYSPEARRQRVQRYLEKRKKRVWTKKVKYDVRKNFADSRLRVKGRFVKKEDEALLREIIHMT